MNIRIERPQDKILKWLDLEPGTLFWMPNYVGSTIGGYCLRTTRGWLPLNGVSTPFCESDSGKNITINQVIGKLVVED